MWNWSAIVTFLPFVFFGIPLLFIFGFFVSGAFALFFSEDSERGKDAIAKALTYFIILLTLFVVFVVVSYLVRQGEIFEPQEPETSGFPASPMGRFPPGAPFAMVGGYSFSGPWPLMEKDNVTTPSIVFAIFCKKDQGYDIIDIGVAYQRKPISTSQNYKCWLENCQNSAANIYVGFYWTPPEAAYLYTNYFNQIKKEVEFICQSK